VPSNQHRVGDLMAHVKSLASARGRVNDQSQHEQPDRNRHQIVVLGNPQGNADRNPGSAAVT
jgi:hypothetical protein